MLFTRLSSQGGSLIVSDTIILNSILFLNLLFTKPNWRKLISVVKSFQASPTHPNCSCNPTSAWVQPIDCRPLYHSFFYVFLYINIVKVLKRRTMFISFWDIEVIQLLGQTIAFLIVNYPLLLKLRSNAFGNLLLQFLLSNETTYNAFNL